MAGRDGARARGTRGRARARARPVEAGTAPPDRLEQAGDEFFARVARAYDEIAADDAERIVVVDGERDVDAVFADVLAAVAPRIGLGAEVPA